MFNLAFFVNSLLLGIGLAMDAFSVSLANGLREPKMKAARICSVAGIFAFFQFLMPLIGWICVHTVVESFAFFALMIPYIALTLLSIIGGKMLIEGIRCRQDPECCECGAFSLGGLMLQGVATSIDALSVGFTISEHNALEAFVCCLVIAIATFAICVGGVIIGKNFGTRLSKFASILGGVILIVIGIEIFVTGMWF